MCGIAGAAWNADGRPVCAEVIDRMTDALQHRGPDGRGTYYHRFDDGSGIGLGHRRLAIVDLDGGRQPQCNEDETIWITFNGEIYNYRELRKDLELRGHRFRTDSDTETIVHLYEDYGIKCVEHLRGMFAFAIWDSNERTLFLARDRLGQKPVVYSKQGGGILFGSEIKSILQVPGVRREVDPDALNQYLTLGYVLHPRTMFRGIKKLPPAHFARFKNGQLTLKRYWEPKYNLESNRTTGELREELRYQLTEAVKLRLMGDVPIGAFLSGGIDSTTIVGLMQSLLPRPAQTFTMGFAESNFDESPFAREAATHLGTDHRELQVDPASANLLPTLTWHFDEPFADSSIIPTFGLAGATRSHVKVALTGDGGDELFAGYPRYQTIEKLGSFDRLPLVVRNMIANKSWQWLPGSEGQRSLLARLRFRMDILRQQPDRRYVNWVAYFKRSRRIEMLSNSFLRQVRGRPEDVLIWAMQRSRRSPGERAMHCDLQTYLPGDLLTKIDITSMAHGLECRSPFMDHRVVELAMSIPFQNHRDRRVAKPMLTRTFSDMIPKRLQGRSKMGFTVPLDNWFRGPLHSLAKDMLLKGRATERGYFRMEAVRRLLREHQTGAWNHGAKLWTLVCLEQWHRDYIDALPPFVSPTKIHDLEKCTASKRVMSPAV